MFFPSSTNKYYFLYPQNQNNTNFYVIFVQAEIPCVYVLINSQEKRLFKKYEKKRKYESIAIVNAIV